MRCFAASRSGWERNAPDAPIAMSGAPSSSPSNISSDGAFSSVPPTDRAQRDQSEPGTRIFLPARSAVLRIGVDEMMAEGAVESGPRRSGFGSASSRRHSAHSRRLDSMAAAIAERLSGVARPISATSRAAGNSAGKRVIASMPMSAIPWPGPPSAGFAPSRAPPSKACTSKPSCSGASTKGAWPTATGCFGPVHWLMVRAVSARAPDARPSASARRSRAS